MEYKERVIDKIEMYARELKRAQSDVVYYQTILSALTEIADEEDIPEKTRDLLDSMSYGG